jgi:hypothetical protein
MSKGQFTIDNLSQEFAISVHEITGQGSFESPRLLVPLSIMFKPYKKGEKYPYEEFDLLFLKADLFLTDKNFKAAETIQFHRQKIYQPQAYQFSLVFPLTEAIIFQIEKHRKGNLPVFVQFQLQIAKYTVLPNGKAAEGIPALTVVTGFEQVSSQSHFVIEQSQWIRNVLPSLGHKAAMLIELPIASAILSAEYVQSTAELEKSREYFLQGDYDKTIGHCRSAIEPFKKNMPALKEAITSSSKAEWIKKMQLSTWEWMDSMLKANYTITNKAHHFPSIGHFDRTDAEVILNITTLILSYIAKLPTNMEEQPTGAITTNVIQ